MVDLPEDFEDGDTINAATFNLITDRINAVDASNSDDLDQARLIAALEDTALADNDAFVTLDSQASNAVKRTKWGTIKIALASMFATKVDKSNVPLIVYGNDGNGVPSPWSMQETPAPYTVPYRGGDGTLSAENGTAPKNLVNKNQLDTKENSFLTGTIGTAASTAAKTVTLDAPYTDYVPVVGDHLELTFTNGNTASTPTLAVNAGSVRGMVGGNGNLTAANVPIAAGMTVLMVLRADNSWQWIGSTIGAYSSLSNAEVDAGTSTTGRLITGQVAAYVRGPLLNARTVNSTETCVIAAGSLTQVNGTTIGGVTMAVGDKFVVLGAPAASGAMTTAAVSAVANGLYQVTAVGTNLTVTRAPEMAGTNSPIGKMIRITEGANYGPGVNTIVTVNSPTSGAFTYGTTAMSMGDYFLGYLQTLARFNTLLNAKANGIGISSGVMLDKAIANMHPESSRFTMLSPFLNDQMYNLLRGATLTLTRNGTVEAMGAPDNAFTPDVKTLNISAVNGSSDVLVLEMSLSTPMTYSSVYGIQFSQAFRAQNVQIDIYDSVTAAWINNIATITNDAEGVAMFKSNGGGNGGANPITRVRYTLTNFNSSSGSTIRIVSLFTVGYASPLLRAAFLTLDGGQMLGAIKHVNYTTAGRPSVASLGGGKGWMYYDTTINKPVFSDGTNWRDAAGTII